MKASIISLGCSRNLVDSEIIAGSLKKCGFKIVEAEEAVDLCVVNTCSFIAPAREEAVDTIVEAVEKKKKGLIKRLIVCGCLAQLYKEKLKKELPEVDLIVGTGDFHRIKDFIGSLDTMEERVSVSAEPDYLYDENSPRSLLTPRHYAYVKISEGCSNFCSYCIISRLRGRFRSRPIGSIIEEINGLAKCGAKEVILIGQDTTLFGIDRYGKIMLPELLRRIDALSGVRWARILYTHPAHYTKELVNTIRRSKKVCRYLDIPVQHISDKILKRMNRRTAKDGIMRLINDLRENIPGIALRTSMIVGFPGETDGDFKEVLDFMREVKFEHLGAFLYSREEKTSAARFKGEVPERIKKERLDTLMKLQKKISSGLNKKFLGSAVKVLVDEKIADARGAFLGRTEFDAPEVDGSVYISGKGIKVGEFCDVKVTDTLEYDLVGKKI